MSLSPLQVEIIVSTGLFNDALRRAIELTKGFEKAMHAAYRHGKRHRSRVVTRRKQRSRW